jgi:penicillin-binding protein 2
MFERRIKIVLGLLTCIILLLLLRAAQLQLASASYWRGRAHAKMHRLHFTPATRGRILDIKGREVAVDAACIDLCVDYRAITEEPDAGWVRKLAIDRLHRRLGDDYYKAPRTARDKRIDQEIAAVKQDIKQMWDKIAAVSGQTPGDIEAIRQGIVQRVVARRNYILHYRYLAALKDYEESEHLPWYKRLFLGGNEKPNPDDFTIDLAEESEPHIIIPNYSDTNNELAKHIDDYPGLVLRAGKHRVYPFGPAGAHWVGRMNAVNAGDLEDDPHAGDDLRAYLPNDQIGRGGIEGLCEETLRGTRGSVEYGGGGRILNRTEAKNGGDVRLSLDMNLEEAIMQAFIKRREYPNYDAPPDIREKQHGAAVIIDIKTNQVRAMVSYPSFDPNTLDNTYAKLMLDDLNQPMLNRATQAQYPPGSTAKTIVASGGITDGVISANGTIKCDGYLHIDGRTYTTIGRCWTMKMFHMPGHVIPASDPHPTGLLTASDALQRSCNVFYETLASRMGIGELAKWYDKFGIGRDTGIGIAEADGRIPDPKHPGPVYNTWFSGIGQGDIAATPLQMADVAATLARGGVWIRPTLLADDKNRSTATTRPVSLPPERVDLHLSPDAVFAVHDGMRRVVNTIAGTGRRLHRNDMVVCGKTGSAQVHKLKIPRRDANGDILRVDGRIQYQTIEPGSDGTGAWYQSVGSEKSLVHAWVIGFAPAENPTIAFCVMVEFGGSGGLTAADIAQDALSACERNGYLKATRTEVAWTK